MIVREGVNDMKLLRYYETNGYDYEEYCKDVTDFSDEEIESLIEEIKITPIPQTFGDGIGSFINFETKVFETVEDLVIWFSINNIKLRFPKIYNQIMQIKLD